MRHSASTRLLLGCLVLLSSWSGALADTGIRRSARARPGRLIPAGAPGLYYGVLDGGAAGSSESIASHDSFRGFYRWPAEERDWLQMELLPGPTAYCRDAFTAAVTLLHGDADGKTWRTRAVDPGGSTHNWSVVTYYSSLDGQSNCFVLSSETICNITTLQVTWINQSQAVTAGGWTWNFFYQYPGESEVEYYTDGFLILDRIPPDKVPFYPQGGANPWATECYDKWCKHYELCDGVDNDFDGLIDENCDDADGNQQHEDCKTSTQACYTVVEMGCYLSAMSMALDYHGIIADPKLLNDWLTTYNLTDPPVGPTGFNGASVNTSILPEYGADYGLSLDITRQDSYDGPAIPESELRRQVCTYGPQVVGVLSYSKYCSLGDNKCSSAADCGEGETCDRKPNRHWVTVIGRDDANTTFLIHDPGRSADGEEALLSTNFNNEYYSVKRIIGPEYTVSFGHLTFTYHSPGELLLHDPMGRRTGLDPRIGMLYDEIPSGGYAEEGLEYHDVDQPDLSWDALGVRGPAAGPYRLDVIGTGNGTYDLYMNYTRPGQAAAASEVRNRAVTVDEVHTYHLDLQGGTTTFSLCAVPLGADLSLDHDPGTGQTILSWDPVLTPLGDAALRYDVIRSGNPADFLGGAVCLETDDSADQHATDTAVPAVGGAFYYLVRAENDCGSTKGWIGSLSSGEPRLAVNCPTCDGNGICEPLEDCNTCAVDCDGSSGGPPSSRYCCGDGILDPAEGDGSICDGNY